MGSHVIQTTAPQGCVRVSACERVSVWACERVGVQACERVGRVCVRLRAAACGRCVCNGSSARRTFLNSFQWDSSAGSTKSSMKTMGAVAHLSTARSW